MRLDPAPPRRPSSRCRLTFFQRLSMRILFAFENPLPSAEADAEVFITTAKYLASFASQSWLHLPLSDSTSRDAVGTLAGMPVIRAYAPVRPAALRHLCCGLTMVFRQEFRQADLVYTRNLWVAWLAVLFRHQFVFDHHRPWTDHIPPLRLCTYPPPSPLRLLLNISHSLS